MPFPFLGKYLWGDNPGIAKRHFQTARREHEDLSDIAQVLNNLRAVAKPDQNYAKIERNGNFWTIEVPGPATDQPDNGDNDEPQTIEIVTDVRFDQASRQLQKKTRTVSANFATGSVESGWTLIAGGQATKCD